MDFIIYLKLTNLIWFEVSPLNWWLIPKFHSTHIFFKDMMWLDYDDREGRSNYGDQYDAFHRKEVRRGNISFLFLSLSFSYVKLTYWGKKFPEGYHSSKKLKPHSTV